MKLTSTTQKVTIKFFALRYSLLKSLGSFRPSISLNDQNLLYSYNVLLNYT
jgi:hypothetical protein